MSEGMTHPLLAACGVAHGFGERTSVAPQRVVQPGQVHGCAVATVDSGARALPEEADAIVCDTPGCSVAIVTADCVPLLACTREGSAVAAIHAGWRGLACGVIGAGISALQRQARSDEIVVVIGPHIGPCCYEVDRPVVEALRERHAAALEQALSPTGPGHWELDLAAVARLELRDAGISSAAIGGFESSCTACDPGRFHSYRRDGDRSGRLLHHIAARVPQG